nr:MAG TPA: hypothetical protein [Caudoviricetes sp.]
MAETWFTPKEWKARLVEFAGRRLLRNVANGETVTYDVSRSEGQVSQEGDAFNTKNMNDLEQRISNGFANAKTNIDALNRDLGGLSFGQDANGNWGYKIGGADPVIPFKPDLQSVDVSYKDIIKAGSSKNYNVKEHPHLIIIQASTGTSAGTEESNNWLAYSDGTYGMQFLLTRGNRAPIDIHVVDGLITITAVNLNVSLHDLYYM